MKVENKAVDTVEPGVLMGVDQVQGDWLWVTKQKSGWLSSANVIPAQKAVEYFTTAIRRNPADARLFARRGVARALNQDFQGALKDYHEALRLKPAEAVYYGDRGCFYMAIGDFDRAIADFAEEIKRIDSEDESRRAIRLGWLNQRLAEAQALKVRRRRGNVGRAKVNPMRPGHGNSRVGSKDRRLTTSCRRAFVSCGGSGIFFSRLGRAFQFCRKRRRRAFARSRPWATIRASS